MGQLNDCKYTALRGAGFRGHVNDMTLEWLQSIGATSSQLTDAWLEVTGGNQYNESVMAWMIARGAVGEQFNDVQLDFWCNVATPIYNPAAFVMRMDTALTITGSSPSSSLRVPFRESSTYDFNIDWGDGVTERVATTGVPYVQHDYAVSGIYDIVITGIFPRVNFYNKASNDRSKLIEILQWGDIVWENLATAFAGCYNMQGNWIDSPILSSLTYTPSMFLGCDIFNYPINFNTATVTFAVGMFHDATLFDQDISHLNVSSLNDAEEMLLGSAFSKVNYDKLLDMSTGWSSRPVKPNVRFHAGNAKYSPSSQAGRDYLTNAPNFWIISDGGVDLNDFNQADFLAGDFA